LRWSTRPEPEDPVRALGEAVIDASPRRHGGPSDPGMMTLYGVAVPLDTWRAAVAAMQERERGVVSGKPVRPYSGD